MVKRIAIAKLPESIKFEPYSASNIFNDEAWRDIQNTTLSINYLTLFLAWIPGGNTGVIPVKIGSYYHSDYSPGGVKKILDGPLATAGELVDEILGLSWTRKHVVFDW